MATQQKGNTKAAFLAAATLTMTACAVNGPAPVAPPEPPRPAPSPTAGDTRVPGGNCRTTVMRITTEAGVKREEVTACLQPDGTYVPIAKPPGPAGTQQP